MATKKYRIVLSIIVLCIFAHRLVFSQSDDSENLTFVNTTVQWCNASHWLKSCEETVLCASTLSDNDTYLLEGYCYITVSYQNVPVLYNGSLADLEIDLFQMTYCGLEVIEEDAFRNSIIKTLSLSHNRLKVLEKATFKGAHVTYDLNLNDNLIKTVEEGTFDGFDLDTLDLSGNGLEEVTIGVFAGSSIRYLNIGRNKIRHIQLGVFQNIRMLETLEISNNELKSFEKELFDDLPRLRFLYLKRNVLNNIPQNLFNSKTFLRLDLSGNNISNISSGAFQNSSFRILNLAENKLQTIRNGMFSYQHTCFIHYLILTRNKIHKIEQNALNAVHGGVQLQSNCLRVIKKDTFVNAVIIVLLDNAELKTIELGSFKGNITRHNFYAIASMPLLYLDQKNLDEESKKYLNFLIKSGSFIVRNSSYSNSIDFPFI